MIEKTIIGNILLEESITKQKEITSILKPEFFIGDYAKIIKKICEANQQNIYAEIKTLGFDINILLDCVSNASKSKDYKNDLIVLKNQYLEREYRKIANLKDIGQIRDNIKFLEENAQILDYTEPKTLQQILTQAVSDSANNPFDLDQLPKTGFTLFDEHFKGFMPGQVCTIGGYSGVGKSTLIFSLVRNLCLAHETLIFNLEMDNNTMSARILAGISGVPFYYTINLGNDNVQNDLARFGLTEKLDQGFRNIEEVKLSMIDDQFHLEKILTSIRKKAKNSLLKFVIIDYLQLIIPSIRNSQRHIEIGNITRELKLVAKELGITIILLAQLSRASLNKDEPELNDLRESGSIEQDSDLVFLIWKRENGDRILKLAKDRMFGKFCKVELSYDHKLQIYS